MLGNLTARSGTPAAREVGYDNVVDLAAYRAAREASPQGHTLLLRVATSVAGEEVIRYVGVDETMPLAEARDVLSTVFGAHDNVPSGFTSTRDTTRWLDLHRPLRFYLRATGDHLLFHWGLWQFSLHVGDRLVRDADTPRALCVGGAGDFHGEDFSPSRINKSLTHDGLTHTVLHSIRPGVREVIERSDIFDFIPLLQAMDVERESSISTAERGVLQALPAERTPEGRDAFWVTVLALSCLAAEFTDEVITDTMGALGWAHPDGRELSAAEVKEMCGESLRTLSQVGGYPEHAAAPARRLEIYREVLRGPDR